jgi:hypothetical protein
VHDLDVVPWRGLGWDAPIAYILALLGVGALFGGVTTGAAAGNAMSDLS